MQPDTHLCLSMLWCHRQPTWELHLHPALRNHSVIMSHCTSFLFNNLLAVFHIKWIIQQQTLFLVLTTAAVILHAHRISSKVCWKRYLLSSSILCNSRWGSATWEMGLNTALWHGLSESAELGDKSSLYCPTKLFFPLSHFSALYPICQILSYPN